RIELDVAAVTTEVTVTASRGSVEDVRNSPYVVSVKNPDELASRPLPTLAAALESAPGVVAQQSTYGHASPFLRGLTGYQTLILLDGLRFNTGIFRSGPNQYLAFIDPSQAERLEVTLGPSSAAYGSDSLGGTISVMTQQPRFGADRHFTVKGDLGLFAASADFSGATKGQLAIANDRFWLLVGGNARRHNDLRAGGGVDSHNVFRRYFGLSTGQVRDLVGDRMQDSAFSQYGGHTKVAARLTPSQTLTFWYQRNELAGLRGYRDMQGGLGRLQALFDPQGGQFAYGRYEKLRLGFLDALTGTLSFNSQSDGQIRQALRFSDVISREDNRVNVNGYTLQGATHWGTRHAQVFGGELYNERVTSTRFEDDPPTGRTVQTRALFPDGSRYRTGGLFFQNMTEVVRNKLRAIVGGRFTNVNFQAFAGRNLDAAGKPLGVADSNQTFRDATFHTSLAWQAHRNIGLHVLAGRGFRAPNVSDLGGVGLSGLGYEIPAEQAVALGAVMGISSAENATSAGRLVSKLASETLNNYEAGITLHTRRFYGRVQVFDAEFHDPIVRRTLLFPIGQAPGALGGALVTPIPQSSDQRKEGLLTVATGLDPRAVKTFVNDGETKYYGIESTFRFQASARWTVHGGYSWINGRDLYPDRPVRRLPPQAGLLGLRYVPSGRRMWAEFLSSFAGPQYRVYGGDLDDERIGASRRRTDIATFFNGALAGRYRSGAVFTPTGETLLQIQNRVLPIGATINGVTILNDNSRVPMFSSSKGWVAFDLRGGAPVSERVSLVFGVLNLLDRNYRSHGSGIDSPGINAFAGVKYQF
ncbi:MAG: TonB-dependent receptor, partial [Candidatus Solibacter usitatus]|nr:TonB-dependent receptor [Candidatus Solibacter usitatus]